MALRGGLIDVTPHCIDADVNVKHWCRVRTATGYGLLYSLPTCARAMHRHAATRRSHMAAPAHCPYHRPIVSPRTEYDAAYFAMLRAVEERDSLLRYRDFLLGERDRLDAFAEGTFTAADERARKVRRPIDQTAKPVLEAVGRRRAAVLHELGRIDDRIGAAEEFVTECEADVARLRG